VSLLVSLEVLVDLDDRQLRIIEVALEPIGLYENIGVCVLSHLLLLSF
jgi:hypothetical protein